jgi:predicted CXXCH cytochrome family protein
VGLAAIIVGLLVFWSIPHEIHAESPAPAFMSDPAVTVEQNGRPVAYPPADYACRLCHTDSDDEVVFASSEHLSARMDPTELDNSVHGEQAEDPLICSDCHRPANNYKQPHVAVAAQDLLAYRIENAANCEQCHLDAHPTAHPGSESAIPILCTDCHGAHDVATASTLATVQGTSVCVACHQRAGVDTVEPGLLVTLIQNGFFREETRGNQYCLACHSQPGLEFTFANGDTKSLTIDAEAFATSVHGIDNSWQPLQCIDCHEGVDFPHEPIQATSAREYSLERYPVCQQCHDHNYEKAVDSVHGEAIAQGREEAAVCTDCHHTHDTPPPDEPRERISHTCEQCHSTIFNEYATSVHGEALLSESNPDVPTCIECHGVHNINDPTTALARVRSPLLCAGCHANAELMDKYGISTDVFSTYVADFHGTTVTLFEHQDPTVETNKAVCYDCHGVHNIRPPDEPDAGIRTNLLVTCRQCHPDATDDFSEAWTSHFRPSLEHNTLVYLVNLFYQIVIPATVAFFGFLVLTDIYRRIRLRWKRRTEASPS